MKASQLCLLACLAAALLGGATAQLDDLLGAVSGSVGSGVGKAISDPARLQRCDAYQQANRDKETACTEAGAKPNAWRAGCPEACKVFWTALPQECKDIVDDLGILSAPKDASGKEQKASEFFDKVCGSGADKKQDN